MDRQTRSGVLIAVGILIVAIGVAAAFYVKGQRKKARAAELAELRAAIQGADETLARGARADRLSELRQKRPITLTAAEQQEIEDLERQVRDDEAAAEAERAKR